MYITAHFEVTYTVSSGTLNSTIPYHTIPYHTIPYDTYTSNVELKFTQTVTGEFLRGQVEIRTNLCSVHLS